MPTTVFFDVDPQDEPLVRAKYPDAKFFPATLRGHELIEACRDAEIVSTFIYTPFSKETIDALPNLKLICTRSVGFDHIDLHAAQEKGITVTNVPDYGSHVIAEHVFALLLGSLRHVGTGDARVKAGNFDFRGLRGMALRGKTLGVVGMGKIGRRVIEIAHGFGMNIIARDVFQVPELVEKFGIKYVELDELLPQSDIITLHAPALAETRHMINADAFSKMKNGVVLVNTARGALIDTAALLEALENGKVGHALLDTLENEMGVSSDNALLKHPKVVVTPHIAFYADDSVNVMFSDCFQSIDEFTAGQEPKHKVKVLAHPVGARV